MSIFPALVTGPLVYSTVQVNDVVSAAARALIVRVEVVVKPVSLYATVAWV